MSCEVFPVGFKLSSSRGFIFEKGVHFRFKMFSRDRATEPIKTLGFEEEKIPGLVQKTSGSFGFSHPVMQTAARVIDGDICCWLTVFCIVDFVMYAPCFQLHKHKVFCNRRVSLEGCCPR